MLANSVAEIKNMGPGGECVKNAVNRCQHSWPALHQRNRVKIALHGELARQIPVSPSRINTMIKPDG